MAKKNKREIWIETTNCFDGSTVFKIGTDWGCSSGFGRNLKMKMYEAVKKAVIEACPGAVVNPWENAEPGTPDFK